MSSFHYDFILSKRSSLAKVWLAAHWEKKLSKSQVFETNLQSIVKDILNPKVPIALRTSSHLLVGLVRIYSRKAKYLLKDCSDTLVNIKVAFRPGVSTLDKSVKKRKSVKEVMDCPLFITEKVDLLDQWIPEISNAELDCTLNQSKIEEITLQEEPMKVSSLEDFFDDEGFGEMDIDASDVTEKNCTSMLERVYSFADSAYGTDEATLGETISLTDCSDPFSSLTPLKDVSSSPSKTITSQEKTPKLLLDLDGGELDPEQHQSKEKCLRSLFEDQLETPAGEDTLGLESDADTGEANHRMPFGEETADSEHDVNLVSHFDKEPSSTSDLTESSTTEDVLVLDPIEVTEKKATSTRKGLKRKLLIDEVITIERAVIFDNLNNASRLLKTPVMAASSKRRMKQLAKDDESLLSSYPFLELSPVLETLFRRTAKCRTLSTSTDHSGDTKVILKPTSGEEGDPSQTKTGIEKDDLSHLNMTEDNANAVDFDSSAQFIPLQDNEYSSDEESPLANELRYETGLHNGTEFDFTQNTLTTEEETEQILEDENISEDKFCSYVETTVLQSRPQAVRFLQIVGGDGRKLTRKTVARRFLKCLLMQRDARVSLEQDGSFEEILLHPGVKHSSEEVVGDERI